MANTILLRGAEYVVRKEGVTDEAVTPGHLLERGGTNDVQKHSTANGNTGKLFALENDLVGDDIADAYATGETVQFAACPTGTEVYAWLAYGENVAIGAALVSNGDGTLAEFTDYDTSDSAVSIYPAAIVGYALEAVNASAADTRIRVEVA